METLDLERKHHLCNIKERKSSMIKREKCHGDLRSKAPLLWYNFPCLHDKKFHDKYLTMFPWYQKVINRESSREGYLSPILPAMEASAIFWVLQSLNILSITLLSTFSLTYKKFQVYTISLSVKYSFCEKYNNCVK